MLPFSLGFTGLIRLTHGFGGLRNQHQLLPYRTSFGWNDIGCNARWQTRGYAWNYTHSLLFTLSARAYFVNISLMSVIFISSLDLLSYLLTENETLYGNDPSQHALGQHVQNCLTVSEQEFNKCTFILFPSV